MKPSRPGFVLLRTKKKEVVKYHYHFMLENHSTKIPKTCVYSHPEVRGLTSKVMNLGSSQILPCIVQRSEK